MKQLFISTVIFFSSICLSFAQNIGINTDGTVPETGVMLDIKGTNAISAIAVQNVFQVKSFNASGAELKMRMILGTHSTAGSRYGALEVYDAGAASYRHLSLQPTSGFVGIGSTTPATLLANTAVNTLDLAGNGISTRSIAWLTNAQGYVASLINTDATASGRNGLLIKTSATDAASYPLQINVGGNNAMVVRGDRNVGIGTSAPATKLDVQGTSGTTLKIVDGNQASGKILTSDAAGIASWASLSTIPGNCLQNEWSLFPTGTTTVVTTSTFITSATTTKIYVELWGGGGGGRIPLLVNEGNAGGGGGAYAAAYITVTPSTTYTVVIGGAGQPLNNASGNGGTSTFSGPVIGTALTAGGGSRGSLAGAGGTASTTLGAGNAILIRGNDGSASDFIDVGGQVGTAGYTSYGAGGKAGGAGGGEGGKPAVRGGSPGGGGGASGGVTGSCGGVIIRW